MPDIFATYYFVKHFQTFQTKFPNLELKCNFTDKVVDLSRETSDIAIRFSNSPQEWLVGKCLSTTRESIYAAPAYIKKLVSASISEPASFVGWRSPAVHRCKTMRNIETKWELANVNIQLAACKTALGFAQLPCFIGDACSEIRRIPDAKTYKGQDIWMLYHNDLKSTPKIKAFRQFLSEIMKSDRKLFHGQIE